MSFYKLSELRKWIQPEEIARKSLSKNDVLFLQGDEAISVYFVEEGEVLAERYLATGQSLTLFRAERGAALSEEGLFFPERNYTATATKPSVVLSITKATLLARMEESKEFRALLTHCLAERFVNALMYQEFLSINSAEERLYAWIQWRFEREQCDLDLSGRVGGVGAELGLTKESIYRALSRLEDTGKITRDGGKLALTD